MDSVCAQIDFLNPVLKSFKGCMNCDGLMSNKFCFRIPAPRREPGHKEGLLISTGCVLRIQNPRREP